jgi:hypothetical protein
LGVTSYLLDQTLIPAGPTHRVCFPPATAGSSPPFRAARRSAIFFTLAIAEQVTYPPLAQAAQRLALMRALGGGPAGTPPAQSI